MILKERDGIQWLEFELLKGFPIVHGCFKRLGGVSHGHLKSLNVGRNCNDTPDNVVENKLRVKNVLGLQHMVIAKCDHGDKIYTIDAVTCEEPPIADGIATNVVGIALGVTQADCQAAIFYDPVNHALCNVHCGWRGNVKNIYKKAVEHMQRHFKSKPENLLACISPSLGPDSSEFLNWRQELPIEFLDFQFKPTYFDLWEIARWQLEEAGVLPKHIQIAGIDTYVDKEYFSYRRDKLCGRQATVCALLKRE